MAELHDEAPRSVGSGNVFRPPLVGRLAGGRRRAMLAMAGVPHSLRGFTNNIRRVSDCYGYSVKKPLPGISRSCRHVVVAPGIWHWISARAGGSGRTDAKNAESRAADIERHRAPLNATHRQETFGNKAIRT